MEEKEIIKKTVEDIFKTKEIKIEKIILFGSRARGDYKKDSDWDLLIITKEKITREEKLRIAHLIRKELANQLIPIDILIKSEEEVERRKNVIGSVIKTAMIEGIVL